MVFSRPDSGCNARCTKKPVAHSKRCKMPKTAKNKRCGEEMKKNVVFTVCVIMLLSLCACGNPSRASETDSLSKTETEIASEDIENDVLSEDEIKVIVANAIYEESLRRQNVSPYGWPARLNSRIDAGQTSFDISKIQIGYHKEYIIYGNGYFHDVYGKICATFADGSGYGDYTFTVTIPAEGDAECEIN